MYVPSLADIRQFKLETVGRLLESSIPFAECPASALFPPHLNVVGMGFGRKIASGRLTTEWAVRIYVRKKKLRSELGRRESIGPVANGLPTDVIEIEQPILFKRPPLLGGDIAAVAGKTGTTGCLVKVNGTEGYL
jgi:hypothetical protein